MAGFQQVKVMREVISLPGCHLNLNTSDSNKNVRINCKTFTVDASIVACQVKPRGGVAMTDEIIGIESMPGMNSGYTGKGIVCFKAEPYLGSTAGALSGDVRGYEVSLGKPSGAGTISGTMSGIKFINNANATITGGVYCLYALTHGDTQVWNGFVKLPNDGQIAYEASGTGWIKARIGDKHGQIAVTSMS